MRFNKDYSGCATSDSQPSQYTNIASDKLLRHMIQVHQLRSRDYPVILCEQCEKPITDVDLAMVAYEEFRADGGYTNPAFIHKAACDESYKGGRKRQGGWVEMKHFLVRLCHNTGLTQAKMAEAFEGAADLENLG
jgi:hypothetical protein